ncbi:MAG: pca operon transcription factor PcaQ [Pseudomonadota bacterium]
MIDPRIKLRHLRCFLAVARDRSLARAAETLTLSQPAVTKTLQELESVLGARLFERGRRGAALTDAGKLFLPRAAGCLAELERAITSLRRGADAARPALRLGALPTVAASFVPDAVRRFRAADPETVVRIVAGPNLHLLQQLRADALDLVVGRLAAPEAMADLSFVHLYSEPVRFVVRDGHPLLEAGSAQTERIADYPVILPDPDAVIRPAVERLLIALGIAALPHRLESVSTSFGRAFVLDSDAVWVISEGVVARDLARGDLAALDLDTRDTSGPVGLTLRLDRSAQTGFDLLVTAIRQAARERGDGV